MRHLDLELEKLEERIAPGGVNLGACTGGTADNHTGKSHKSKSHNSDKSHKSHKSHKSEQSCGSLA